MASRVMRLLPLLKKLTPVTARYSPSPMSSRKPASTAPGSRDLRSRGIILRRAPASSRAPERMANMMMKFQTSMFWKLVNSDTAA